MSNTYLNELAVTAGDDVAALKRAEKSYGDSWKKRGGVGAFMMLARKWDRLENRLANPPEWLPDAQMTHDDPMFNQYDIFGAVATDQRAEGVIDDIRDLRRYLLLVEAELRATGRCPGKLAKDMEAGCGSKCSTEGAKLPWKAGDPVEINGEMNVCVRAGTSSTEGAKVPQAHANDCGCFDCMRLL